MIFSSSFRNRHTDIEIYILNDNIRGVVLSIYKSENVPSSMRERSLHRVLI